MRFLRYLRTFRGPSWLLCFLSLEFCYICYFCDICHGCFKLARKILVTFAMFAIFADISGPFLASLLSKSGILLHLLFFRFLRYLSWVFLASKKNPCYICDFILLVSSFSKSRILLNLLFLRYLFKFLILRSILDMSYSLEEPQ